MIIKSHIRGGYRAAADYLKEQGKNEKIRLVQISDPDANNLDEAFHNMWQVASTTHATKPLHHISINPMKDERLTDRQLQKIVERCEQKYGYKSDCHQRVIVEHIRDGRQHFHVMWNRVSLDTGKTVWPGEHWKKSKQVCREMEEELGLKCPIPKRVKRIFAIITKAGRQSKYYGRYQTLNLKPFTPSIMSRPMIGTIPKSVYPSRPLPPLPYWVHIRRRKQSENIPASEQPVFGKTREQELLETLIWAWESKNFALLREFGIMLPVDYFEP
jgi:hypothetical protein